MAPSTLPRPRLQAAGFPPNPAISGFLFVASDRTSWRVSASSKRSKCDLAHCFIPFLRRNNCPVSRNHFPARRRRRETGAGYQARIANGLKAHRTGERHDQGYFSTGYCGFLRSRSDCTARICPGSGSRRFQRATGQDRPARYPQHRRCLLAKGMAEFRGVMSSPRRREIRRTGADY